MATVVFVRHGRTRANVDGILAGWTDGVFLDEVGIEQARTVGQRLADTPLTAVVASPLDRAQQTADAICAAHPAGLTRHTEQDFGEVRYGTWSGRPLRELADEGLWQQVQQHPTSVTFPSGESMAGMQARAIRAVRHWNEVLGPEATYAIVSHGDVIKALLADALGLHLDHFQRIVVEPCSVSVVRYGVQRPFVLRMNDSGCDLGVVTRGPGSAGEPSEAVVGGGA